MHTMRAAVGRYDIHPTICAIIRGRHLQRLSPPGGSAQFAGLGGPNNGKFRRALKLRQRTRLRVPWFRRFFLLGANEFDRTGYQIIKVIATQKVAIDRDVAADLPARNEKRFHDDGALIIDFPQSTEDFRPRHPSEPGWPSVCFAEVEMSEPSLRLE